MGAMTVQVPGRSKASKGNESECSGHDRAPPARHSLSRRPRPHSSFPQILAPKPWRYVVRSRPPATARCPSSPLPSWVGQSPQSRLSPRDLCALLVACPLAQTDSHPRRRARVASPAPHPHLCARGSSKAMLGRSVVSLSRALGAAVPVQPVRYTWILRRVYAPEPTPPGRVQRNPEELPNLMKLEVVEIEDSKPAGRLRAILQQDIEGIGHQFDVVDVDRKLARADLLPTRKAVYASPFDLQYYARIKEEMVDELSKRVRIPYEFVCIGRDLQSLIVPIKVSMDNKWTLDKQILKTSLRQMGVDMLDDAVFFDQGGVNGPNFDLEAKLIRFYVVISRQYIVPMIGRISHISVDESKQMLVPRKSQAPTEEQLTRYGIHAEQPHYSQTPDIDENFPVVDFMRNKARST